MNNKYQLTIEEIKEELKLLTNVEDQSGFLYFCKNYVKVSHPSKGSVAFKDDMYKWQATAAKEMLSHTSIISKKVRQTGFSTIVACYALWRALFFNAQNIQIISLTQRESTDLLRRLKFTYNELPNWLKQPTDEFAKTTISFEHNGSKVTAIPRSADAGRGGSISLLIIDEFAAMDRQKDLLASAIPALSAGMLTNFSNSSLPSQLFLISTLPQNPIDNEYLRILHNAQDNPDESKFHIIDVDTSDIPQYQDPEWHKAMRESLGERIYKIEILGVEVYDIEEALVPSHVIEMLQAKSPIRTDFLYPDDVNEEGFYKDFNRMLEMHDNFDGRYNYIKTLWIWEDPVPGKQYIVIVDVATGRADDYSTILVMDPENGNNQVAELRNRIDTETLKHIIELVCEYYNKAKLSIESTGLGSPVVEYFATTLNYENLYWHAKSKRNYVPGFPMSSSIRANAIAIFQTMMLRNEFKINSVRLINEIRGFGYSKSGKITALNGHDDIIMALIQYSYLQHLGWAATDRIIKSQLMFGDVVGFRDDEDVSEGDDVDDHTKSTKKIKKYWEEEKHFNLDSDVADLMAMADINGCSIELNINDIISQWKD